MQQGAEATESESAILVGLLPMYDAWIEVFDLPFFETAGGHVFPNRRA